MINIAIKIEQRVMPNLRKEPGVELLRDQNFMHDFYRAREAWTKTSNRTVSRVTVNAMDTRAFHGEMERRKKERTEKMKSELNAKGNQR